MKRCKHKHIDDRYHLDHVRNVMVDRWRCVDCGELVGMGPAAPEDRVEYLAACLIQDFEHNARSKLGTAWLLFDELHDDDFASWLSFANDLARCIADHDELQRTGEDYDTKIVNMLAGDGNL